MALFGLACLVTLVAVHVALFLRLVRPIQRSGGRWCAGILIVLSFIASGGGMALSRVFPNAATEALQRIGYVCLPVILYLVLPLVLFDVTHLAWRLWKSCCTREPALESLQNSAPQKEQTAFERGEKSSSDSKATTSESSDGQLSRRQFLKASAGTSVALASISSVVGMGSAFTCGVQEVDIALEKLPENMDGFTFALLSDIHVGGWVDRVFVESLVEKTNALDVDAVLICGDLVDGTVEELSKMVVPLGNLKSRQGTFFTIGNHEIYSGVEAWCAFLKTLDIRVLRNERVELLSLDLLGVDDVTCARRGIFPGYSLDGVLSSRRKDVPAILLTHQPRGFRDAAKKGIDLQLSGHTHGGQMFPFHPIAECANEGFLAGLYREGRSQIYVTRGCGFWGPPVRVGAPPEITKITLRSPLHAP